jgi:endoglucanase
MSAPATLLQRRILLGGGLACSLGRRGAAQPSAASEAAQSAWEAFKHRFLADDGRVIDTGNARVSHSEGQGWGMLFAAHFDDPASFARMLGWTTQALRRPHDALHVWRYLPDAAEHTPDPNNATDGDLYIAWALALAATQWRRAEYAEAAAAIARDVLARLTARAGDRLLLLPGITGFTTPEHVVVNPSYTVFAAFPPLARLCPSPLWATLRRDGRALLDTARFGNWHLPPDWLAVPRHGGALAPASAWPPRCSYDAMRVPLQLALAGIPDAPVLASFAALLRGHDGELPAWVDLRTGATAPYMASPGMAAAVGAALVLSGQLPGPLALPAIAQAPDYYSAALTLLARIALADAPPP